MAQKLRVAREIAEEDFERLTAEILKKNRKLFDMLAKV